MESKKPHQHWTKCSCIELQEIRGIGCRVVSRYRSIFVISLELSVDFRFGRISMVRLFFDFFSRIFPNQLKDLRACHLEKLLVLFGIIGNAIIKKKNNKNLST